VAFAFGETVGLGLPFVGATVAVAKAGFRVLSDSFVGRVVNGVFESAAKSTKIFVAKELVSVTGAATGAALSEAVLPGDRLARVGAEIAGGVVAPGRLIISAGVFTKNQVVRVLKTLSPAMQRSEAARIIQSAFKESGDDIVLTATLIEQGMKDFPQSPATVAQTAANRATMGLETAVRKLSASKAVDIDDQAAATLSVMRNSILLLRGTGDPSALRAAAEIESRYFFALLSERANAAKQVAVAAASKLPDTNIDRAALSVQAFDSASLALEQSRVVERELWDLVPSGLPAKAANLVQGLADLRASMLPRTEIPRIIRLTLADIIRGKQEVTVGFLKIFRSDMLREARAATAKADNASAARFFGHMAEAALDDIDTVFKGADSGVFRVLEVDEAYNNARKFSAALHDAFTNSFTGKSLSEGRTGLRQPAEVLLGRAFAGGREATAHRLVELEESVRFLPDMGRGGQEAIDNFGVMIDAQERFFAILATDTAATGLEKVKFIQAFLTKNPQLAERFPSVTSFLKDIAKTEAGAAKAIDNLTTGMAAIEKRAAFAKFTARIADNRFESPVDAMGSVFRSNAPARELTSIAKLAAQGGDEVVEGFKATVYDHAIRESTRPDGGMDFVKMRKILLDPISPGKPSAVDIMTQDGALLPAGVTQLKKVLDAADQVILSQAARGGGVVIEEIGAGITGLVIRAHGSKAAVAAMGGGSGSSLIIAAGGAKLAEQIVSRTPNAKVAKLVAEAMLNGKLFLALSRKHVSDAEAFGAALALNSLLVQLGMRPVTGLGIAAADAAANIAVPTLAPEAVPTLAPEAVPTPAPEAAPGLSGEPE